MRSSANSSRVPYERWKSSSLAKAGTGSHCGSAQGMGPLGVACTVQPVCRGLATLLGCSCAPCRLQQGACWCVGVSTGFTAELWKH